jgi:enterochelin esterase-like enzyme
VVDSANVDQGTVLQAKGHDVIDREFWGGHDYLSWVGSLGDALVQMAGPAALK